MPRTFVILVINPGSTSTKVALFENEKEVFSKTIAHGPSDLAPFKRMADQYDMRFNIIEKTLQANGVNLKSIDAVMGRGGLLKPVLGGVYAVNARMLEDLRRAERGEHASNLGALIADAFAQKNGVPAYIADPVVVDEMDPMAKVTGIPEIERRSIFHALNHKAVARKVCAELGLRYGEARLIVAHLGGGISVGVHLSGRVVDVNNALDGDGPFSPERAGTIPAGQLAALCFSGGLTPADVKSRLTGRGGLVAHLGTNDIRVIEEKIRNGDERARLVLDAMIYQIAKHIGAAAAVLDGRVDAIAASGGLAMDDSLVMKLKSKVGWIAKVMVYPGEEEMHALALGALDVLNKRVRPGVYA
jgi:butyrate kinase